MSETNVAPSSLDNNHQTDEMHSVRFVPSAAIPFVPYRATVRR